MKKIDVATSLRAVPEWVGTKALTVVGILVPAGCYFAGASAYQAYLGAFNADAEAFPIDQASHLINGVQVSFGFIADIFRGDPKSWLVFVTYCVASAFGGFVWSLVQQCLADKILETKPSGWRGKVGTAWLGTIWILLVVAALDLLGIAVALPGVIGETAGSKQAEEKLHDFNQGCQNAVAKCISLKKDGKELTHGFRVAQSKDRISVYLSGVTTEYEATGLSIETLSK